MKKRLVYGAAIMLALTLTGCNNSTDVPNTSAAVAETIQEQKEETTAPAETTEAADEEPFVVNFEPLKSVENASELSETIREANTYDAILERHNSYKQISGHLANPEAVDADGNPVKYKYNYNSVVKVSKDYSYIQQYEEDEWLSAVLVRDGRVLLTQPSVTNPDESETDLILTSFINGEEVANPSYWPEQINPADYGEIYAVEEDGKTKTVSIFNDLIDEAQKIAYRYITKIVVDAETSEIKTLTIEQYSNDEPDVEMNGGVSYRVDFEYDNANLTSAELKPFNAYNDKEETDIKLEILQDGKTETYTEKGAVGTLCLASSYGENKMLFYTDKDRTDLVFTGEFEVTPGLAIYGSYVTEDVYADAYNAYMSELYSGLMENQQTETVAETEEGAESQEEPQN